VGDQDDLPLDHQEEVQQGSMHKRSQPVDKLDKMVEEIRDLMMKLAEEVVSRRRLNKEEPAGVARKQQQQQQSRREGGHLQREVCDPGGFQNWIRGAHEQELMIFPAVEYDARASFPPQHAPVMKHINANLRKKRGANPLIFPSI
jgi:hypothetical protein